MTHAQGKFDWSLSLHLDATHRFLQNWLFFTTQRLSGRLDALQQCPFALNVFPLDDFVKPCSCCGSCCFLFVQSWSKLKAYLAAFLHDMQGNSQEELPEVALGGVRINALDLLAAHPLDLSVRAPRQESLLKEESPTMRR